MSNAWLYNLHDETRGCESANIGLRPRLCAMLQTDLAEVAVSLVNSSVLYQIIPAPVHRLKVMAFIQRHSQSAEQHRVTLWQTTGKNERRTEP
jgi:hypothetical protein